VNFGPVTPEFKRVKIVHPSSIRNMATFAILLDLARMSTKFSGTITTQFCFTYTLEGVTAMPRGLHAIALSRISSFLKQSRFNVNVTINISAILG